MHLEKENPVLLTLMKSLNSLGSLEKVWKICQHNSSSMFLFKHSDYYKYFSEVH